MTKKSPKKEEDKTLQLFSSLIKVVDHLHDNINHGSEGVIQYDDDGDDADVDVDDFDDGGHDDDDHRHAPADDVLCCRIFTNHHKPPIWLVCRYEYLESD